MRRMVGHVTLFSHLLGLQADPNIYYRKGENSF